MIENAAAVRERQTVSGAWTIESRGPSHIAYKHTVTCNVLGLSLVQTGLIFTQRVVYVERVEQEHR